VLRVLPMEQGQSERIVELEGDAYFNVIHDAQRRFSVHTAHATIEDVGTRFTVRARSTEKRVEVAVAKGEVKIEAAADETGPSARRHRSVPVHAGRVAIVDEHGAVTLLSGA